MKSDREFIEGIYRKAKKIEDGQDGRTEQAMRAIPSVRKYIPAAACLLFIIALIPFINNISSQNTPQDKSIERSNLSKGLLDNQNPSQEQSDPMNGTMSFSLEPSPKTIAVVVIIGIEEKDSVQYILAEVQNNLQGVTEQLLLIQYEPAKDSQVIEFTVGERDILYLDHTNSEGEANSENGINTESEANSKNGVSESVRQEFAAIYQKLFQDLIQQNPDIQPEPYFLFDAVHRKYTYKEEFNGAAIYESAGGTRITEEEILQGMN